ncbi:hypothetical protein E2493_06440 [Sphingomonas parva]|uniref:Uncharacterized protein n=1 Tax=Sphingomonas parva TaxID=2555898 RepID=A0A4Y8ZT11_9SPHN|nr:hypothetical protein [Sphingomonas parva]TFI59158.1 hypothetical protein E2493_06440 [Sphingomonas parva]
MRKLVLAASALAFAAPLAAQTYPDPRDEEIVRSLPAPGEVEELGDRVGAVAEAILDTPVGPLREAVEGRRLDRREREETLGDVASRDDPYARERVRDEVAAATAGLGAAVEQFAVVAPVLRRSIEDAARRMEDAIEHRRGRRYDDRYDPRD